MHLGCQQLTPKRKKNKKKKNTNKQTNKQTLRGKMSEVAEWLHGLKLGRYSDTFAQHGIDTMVCCEHQNAHMPALTLTLTHFFDPHTIQAQLTLTP